MTYHAFANSRRRTVRSYSTSTGQSISSLSRSGGNLSDRADVDHDVSGLFRAMFTKISSESGGNHMQAKLLSLTD
jgi:hypothetical protein